MSDLDELVKAAGGGDAEAQFQLAEALRLADPPEYERAARWYRYAAEQGHAEAQNALGSMLLNGMGGEPDEVEAALWYRSAALQGERTAQYNLGVRYREGQGVPLDLPEAVKWLTLSSEQGYPDAMNDLGVCYEFGFGVEKSLEEAARLFAQAAELGDVVASANLVLVSEEMQSIAKQKVPRRKVHYIALIAYGEDDFGKFYITAPNDAEAVAEAKEKARSVDGSIVTLVQGKNFESSKTRVVNFG